MKSTTLVGSLLFMLGVLGCSSVKQDLGVDIYPGAIKDPNGTMVGSAGGAGMSTVKYTSPDEQSKVAQFYKDKYPQVKPREIAFGGNAASIFPIEDAQTKTAISVMRKQGDKVTTIQIMSGKQDEK